MEHLSPYFCVTNFISRLTWRVTASGKPSGMPPGPQNFCLFSLFQCEMTAGYRALAFPLYLWVPRPGTVS